MGRRLRELCESGMYHVTARGNDRQPIFLQTVDKASLLVELGVSVVMFELEVISYAVLSNHLHLAVKVNENNLSLAMQRLYSVYARKYNRLHGRIDHVFGERFHSVPIVREGQLANVVRYHDWNAARAGLCSQPSEWPWSSYRAVAGLVAVPSFLSPHHVLEYFDPDPRKARMKYRAFVAEGGGPKTDEALRVWLESDELAA